MPRPYLIGDGTPEGTMLFGQDGNPIGGIQRLVISIDIDTGTCSASGQKVVFREIASAQRDLRVFEVDTDLVTGQVKTQDFHLENVCFGKPDI